MCAIKSLVLMPSPMFRTKSDCEGQTNDVSLCSSQDSSGSTGKVGKG
jgi:hypothetical protein